MSDSLWPHGLQHTRIPHPSLFPRVCSNSCPLSQWCHPTISSSVIPFSSRLQSFPAAGSFPMSPLFTSGGQNIGASASVLILPLNIQSWFPLGLTSLMSLMSKELSRVFSRATNQRHQLSHVIWFFSCLQAKQHLSRNILLGDPKGFYQVIYMIGKDMGFESW